MNFTSRPFAALASIAVEYTSDPVFLILPMAFISLFAVGGINPLRSEKVDKSEEKHVETSNDNK